MHSHHFAQQNLGKEHQMQQIHTLLRMFVQIKGLLLLTEAFRMDESHLEISVHHLPLSSLRGSSW